MPHSFITCCSILQSRHHLAHLGHAWDAPTGISDLAFPRAMEPVLKSNKCRINLFVFTYLKGLSIRIFIITTKIVGKSEQNEQRSHNCFSSFFNCLS